MTLRDTRSVELWLGPALLALGAAFMVVASRSGPATFHFVPALDGCLTMGVVALLLSLLEGIPFSRAVIILVPVVAIQTVGTREHHASWFAVVGIEALIFGAIGTLLAMRSLRASPPSQASKDHRPAPIAGALPPLHEGASA